MLKEEQSFSPNFFLRSNMKLNGSAVVREFYRQEVLAQADEDLSVKKFMDALDIFCDQNEVARARLQRRVQNTIALRSLEDNRQLLSSQEPAASSGFQGVA